MSVSAFTEITKTQPEKGLIEALRKSGGRNNTGRITSRHRGGGHKRFYRIIDFKRSKDGMDAKVAAIEYDPNRSARIALLQYADGERRYIIAPDGVKVGEVLRSGADAEIKNGNTMPLANIPAGTFVHNIELRPGRGGQLARSAGMAVQLMAKEGALKDGSDDLVLVYSTEISTVPSEMSLGLISIGIFSPFPFEADSSFITWMLLSLSFKRTTPCTTLPSREARALSCFTDRFLPTRRSSERISKKSPLCAREKSFSL